MTSLLTQRPFPLVVRNSILAHLRWLNTRANVCMVNLLHTNPGTIPGGSWDLWPWNETEAAEE